MLRFVDAPYTQSSNCGYLIGYLIGSPREDMLHKSNPAGVFTREGTEGKACSAAVPRKASPPFVLLAREANMGAGLDDDDSVLRPCLSSPSIVVVCMSVTVTPVPQLSRTWGRRLPVSVAGEDCPS